MQNVFRNWNESIVREQRQHKNTTQYCSKFALYKGFDWQTH